MKEKMFQTDFEKLMKVVTYSLILIFKLSQGNISSKKMAIFFSGCHFVRRIRQFVFKKSAHVQETPRELIQKILEMYEVYTPDIDVGNIFIVGNEFLPAAASNQPKWFLVQAENIYRWVTIAALPIKNMGNKCFASHQLMYNLFHKSDGAKESSSVHIFPETMQTSCSGYADSAHIALVNSAAVDDDLNRKLKNHFIHSKYVQINDLVKVDDSLSFVIRSVEAPKDRSKNIGFFLEHGKSSLFQDSSRVSKTFPINFKLKKNLSMANLETCEQIQDCLLLTKPSGLSDYCEKLQGSVAPYLMRHDSLGKPYRPLPSFLLSGTSGSGKRTIIKSVAESLGIHFMEVSCLSLIGESTKATELRIQNAFQSAQQTSPSFLYITDIEVYCLHIIILTYINYCFFFPLLYDERCSEMVARATITISAFCAISFRKCARIIRNALQCSLLADASTAVNARQMFIRRCSTKSQYRR